MLTFKDYLRRYARVNHRLGDLADDMALDDSYPNSTDFNVNLQHLIDSGASSACIDTFYDAWMMYRKHPEDQTELHLSMMMEKLDGLIHAAERIADSMEILADIQNPENPLVSISDEVESLSDAIGYYSDGGAGEIGVLRVTNWN